MWLGNPNNPGMFPKNNPQKNCSEQGVSSDFANTHQGKCLTPEKNQTFTQKKSPKHVPSKQSKKMFHHLLSFPYLSQHPLGRLRPVECHPWPRHVQATQRRQAPVPRHKSHYGGRPQHTAWRRGHGCGKPMVFNSFRIFT